MEEDFLSKGLFDGADLASDNAFKLACAMSEETAVRSRTFRKSLHEKILSQLINESVDLIANSYGKQMCSIFF